MKKYILGLALSLASSLAFAGGEDIYPEGFVEDCSYASVDATFASKLLEFTGNEVDKAKASKEFKPFCSCLSDKFFERPFDDRAYAYEVYITMVQYNGRVNAPARLKGFAMREINACKVEANKTRVSQGVARFDSQYQPSGDLQATFMKDIRSSLGKGQNEGYLRKAEYLSKCMADRVEEYSAREPSTDKAQVIARVRQNLKAGTFVNVPTNENNRAVELMVLRVDDNCW